MENELIAIWEDVIGVSLIVAQDNFFDLGGHSMLAVMLINEIEKKLCITVSLTTLFENPSIVDLVKVLQDSPEQTYPQTLIPIKEEGSRRPFFCVNGPRENLVQHLEPEQPYYWLSYVYQGGVVSDLSVEELASIQIRNIKEIQPQGPYQLGGFSFGGTVAFEMAQQLRQTGEEVCLLVLLDPASPQLRQVQKGEQMTRRLIEFKAQKGLLDKLTLIASKAIDWLFWRARIFLKKSYQILLTKYYIIQSRALPPELCAAHNLKLFRRLAGAYHYKTYPDKILLFVPKSRKESTNHIRDIREQWQDVAVNGVEIVTVDNVTEHLQLIEEPHVQTLARYLSVQLAASES